MTLTRMIPSLRRTLPDPLRTDFWPEATVTTVHDVMIAGVSLSHLADVCGTPCVHTGAAVIPGTAGRPSPTSVTSVLVTAITGIATHPSGALVITADAALDEHRVVWSELRLIRRVSTAHSGTVLIAGRSENPAVADLPLDLVIGDLLAAPTRPAAATMNGRRASRADEHSVPAWLAQLP
ncbi:hypothetical protein EYE40_13695 [Glaciihabitans arcticus]|uniref:Uncharacterized protein n=1 Tax=Glaciihabitans arcticus TaxID=2668039 RepID=A0A4Q9H0X2_9MICO|nr:hypothetical protein [Glaciihabitans arcticus]TBN58360.1 hypothetical protein EYE40_13695 [Glaciihabitans arcticus]